jgi:hypothetical protein
LRKYESISYILPSRFLIDCAQRKNLTQEYENSSILLTISDFAHNFFFVSGNILVSLDVYSTMKLGESK